MIWAPEWARKKIQEAEEKQRTTLDLRWTGSRHNEPLKQIPDEVFEMEHLEGLDLRFNRLTAVPEAIGRLRNLTVLDFGGNWIAALPEAMLRLESLRTLRLQSNRLAALPEWLPGLTSLTDLDISRNPLAELPDWLGDMRSLTRLHMAGPAGYELEEAPGWLAELRNLVYLDLGGHRLADLPGRLAGLQTLSTLQLNDNRFTAIPAVLADMPALEALSLNNAYVAWTAKGPESYPSRNAIKVIPEEIAALPRLRDLRLGGNPIEEPPPEVVGKMESGQSVDLAKIRDYYRQRRETGTDCLYEAKLLIVGEAGAGKTSLARKLQDPAYRLRGDEESTQGIGVLPWQFALSDGRPFRANIWDFGGQEIYHATHQFFLTKRSLYLLVADTRKEDTDFYYWLNAADLLSDHSPLLVVKNEKQDRHREINERQLKAEFSNLAGVLAANLADNRGLDDLVGEIKHQVRRLPHVGAALPRTWVRVREALEKDPRPYIGVDEFLEICQKNGFDRLEDKLQLSGYLHDLGVCLHFQDDPILKRTVILKPEWGTAAVYKALDNPGVIRNLGRFTRADLRRIWDEPQYEGMHDELLQLMMRFRLCYPLPNQDGAYIAPQLLTENQPEYRWDEEGNLLLRYRYEFMPKGILTRLIVAMHPLLEDQRLVWRSGAILAREGARAEVVEHYSRREVRVRVSGRQKKGLMAIVTWELERIHDSFNRLRYSALIPCRCVKCRDSQEPYFYPLEVLQRCVAENRAEIQCQASFDMVDVWAMVNDTPALRRPSGRDLPGAEGRAAPGRLRAVHDLLAAAYIEGDLRRLFVYTDNTALRPLQNELSAADGLEQMIEKAIRYCDTRGLLPDLLREVEKDRPKVFSSFQEARKLPGRSAEDRSP